MLRAAALPASAAGAVAVAYAFAPAHRSVVDVFVRVVDCAHRWLSVVSRADDRSPVASPVSGVPDLAVCTSCLAEPDTFCR